MPKIWDREPVLILTALGNLIALAAAFGFDLTSTQRVTLLAVAASALALIGRSQVKPVKPINQPPEVD